MDKAVINQIQELLLSQRKEIIDSTTTSTDIDFEGDETDEIQAKQLASISAQLSERAAHKLHKIDVAFSKIQNSTYGKCEDCDDEIAEKRLIFNPHFLTCISCAEAREMEENNRKKMR